MATLEEPGQVFGYHHSMLCGWGGARWRVELVPGKLGDERKGDLLKSGAGICRTANHVRSNIELGVGEAGPLRSLTTSCQTLGVTTVGSRASENAFAPCLAPDPVFTPKGLEPALFFGLCLLLSLAPSPPPTLSLLLPPPPPPTTGGGYVHSLPLASHARHVVSTPPLMHLTFERRQRAHAMLERIAVLVAC